MKIKLDGVSTEELALALKYSGLVFMEDGEGGGSIKPIPSFIRTTPACGCDLSKQIARAKIKLGSMETLVEELSLKLKEMRIHIEPAPTVQPTQLPPLEFWEKQGKKVGSKVDKKVRFNLSKSET